MENPLVICALFLLACHLSPTIASSSTAPAFLWSDHRSVGLNTQGAVDYRVFSSQALVDTLLQKFDWSSLLCNINGGEKEGLDAVVAFIGKELHSEDIARDTNTDRLPVLRILKDHFTASPYSMALPYVSVSTENGGVLNTLVSNIKDSCSLKTRPGKTVILGSCLNGKINEKRPYLTEGIELVDDAESLKDFILSRKANRATSETDIILACSASNIGIGGEPEGETLATILSALRQSGTSNAVLYASDPVEVTRGYSRYKGRVLASNATSTTTTTCDEVCETVVGVYEGILVAVTLLIILISGLCCMMGIDTPSRFETASDA